MTIEKQKSTKQPYMHSKDIVPKNAEGKRHGLCSIHYDNGQLAYISEFINGLAHGPQEFFLDNGELCNSGCYNMGNKIGLFIWQYPKRKKNVEFYAQ